MTSEVLRVLVADDHPVSRFGLRALLASVGGFEVVGEAATGGDAVAIASALHPDVVVMDVRMPGLNGVEATRRIVGADPAVAVLVLTMFGEDTTVAEAMRAGARGYVCKDADPDELLVAIQAVGRGEAVFGPSIAKRVREVLGSGAPKPRPFPELSPREFEVLELMASWAGHKQIAQHLGLSPKTVRNLVSRILSALLVEDRAQAIHRAREAGLGRPLGEPGRPVAGEEA